MMKNVKSSLRSIAMNQGFITPTWEFLNPFWKLSVVFGSVTLGWGLNDMSRDLSGISTMVIGASIFILGSRFVEYMFAPDAGDNILVVISHDYLKSRSQKDVESDYESNTNSAK